MTKERHRELLDKLDIFIGPTTKEPIINKCCENPDIRTDGISNTCIKCGRMSNLEEIIIKKQFLNPKYQLSTNI